MSQRSSAQTASKRLQWKKSATAPADLTTKPRAASESGFDASMKKAEKSSVRGIIFTKRNSFFKEWYTR